MKAVFFGLGSIGTHHANILTENYGHKLFAFRTKKEKKNRLSFVNELYTWEELKRLNADVAFITNPTFLHIDTAIRCAELGIRLFIEKPIGSSADGLGTLLKKVDEKKLVTYVAYNLRFHPVIEYLKKSLSSKKIYHISIYASSYLPNWRPGEDHKSSYAVSRDKGGGIILELSHEFDYVDYLFGPIQDIDGVFGRASNITRDAEDFLDALVKTKKAPVNLHLDFLSMHNERNLKIDCEGEFIYADLIKNRVEIYNEKGLVNTTAFESGISDTYKKQIEYFFKNINNNRMMNNLNEAAVLFKKILKVRED